MSPIRMEKAESAIRMVIEFTDAFNRRDVARMAKLLADDCVFEDASPAPCGSLSEGREAIARRLEEDLRAHPDSRMEIEEIQGWGLRCVLRWKLGWTDAEGGKRQLRGADIFRLREGLICQRLSYVKGER